MAQQSEESKALRELLRTAVAFEKTAPHLSRIAPQRQALRDAIAHAQLLLSLEKQGPSLPPSDSKGAAADKKVGKHRS
jgi:hypothetical protein